MRSMRNLWLIAVFLTILAMLSTLRSSAAEGQDNIFFENLKDPENDANGPGTYELPLASVYRENGQPSMGLLDIRKFTFRLDDESVAFELTFGKLGENIWSGPCGFSLEIVEIYVDCRPGGSTDAVVPTGPKVRMDEKHPWDFAVQATGWTTPDQRGNPRNWLTFWDGTQLTDKTAVRGDSENQRISISIQNKDLEGSLGSLPESYPWYAVVVVGSQDGYGESSWRAVYPRAETWGGGGADPEAYMASPSVSPNVYDILVPEGLEQRVVLSGYDATAGTYAMAPAICLMPELVKPEQQGEGVEEGGGLPYLSFVVVGSGFVVGLVIAMIVKPMKKRGR